MANPTNSKSAISNAVDNQEFPGNLSLANTPIILPEPCPQMTVREIAYKKFPGPNAPVLCGEPQFTLNASPGEVRIGINAFDSFLNDYAADRNLDVGGPPDGVSGLLSRARGAIEDTGRRGGAVYNVLSYNASNDGITDSTLAIQNCIDIATLDHPEGGAVIYFPPGVYKCWIAAIGPSGAASVLNVSVPHRFIGAGMDLSTLDFSGAQSAAAVIGLFFRIIVTEPPDTNDRQFKELGTEHLGIIGSTSGNSVGTAFHAHPNSNKPLPAVRVRNCHYRGASIDIQLGDTYAFVIDSNVFRGAQGGGTEISIQNLTYPDAGDSTIICNYFDGKQSHAQNILHNGSGGLRVENNKFNGGAPAGNGPDYHYRNLNVFAQSGTSQAYFIGNSFENVDLASIDFSNDYGYDTVVIVGNTFGVRGNSAGILLRPGINGVLRGVIISSNIFGGSEPNAGMTCVQLAPAGAGTQLTDVMIFGNIFGTTAYPVNRGVVNLGAPAAEIQLGGNRYFGPGPTITGAFSAWPTTEGAATFVATNPLALGMLNNITATVGAAGVAAALPATPETFIDVIVQGVALKIPAYLP